MDLKSPYKGLFPCLKIDRIKIIIHTVNSSFKQISIKKREGTKMEILLVEEIKKQFGYDYVGRFYECLARAEKGTQRFHIRPDGQPAYEQRYDDVGIFSEGLAPAKKEGQWFHIRPDGQPAYEQRYIIVGLFFEGLALVESDGQQFRICRDGTRVEE
ncbi:MAG: hypothetical protein A2Z68_01800 [Candidatus Nealsonbacteria bacterium RBG_13_38_11]|uniref:Uncharacterized protein n=1 Tax=Candidatus Nealsonbacteria bacterium RBG_13_38_11 TaxID=1801662 RepID=A0A1G2DYZ6_9BACT|nr:MAG: hypothetical protein A2Z68_01800 [Candidatus Nealsonbacteria bacterium RBG_13_38_11]